MFTERFIKVMVEVISSAEAEVVGNDNAERIVLKGRINPFEIAHYREELEEGRTVVQLRSGEELVVVL